MSNILVIDDDVKYRESMKLILTLEKFKVKTAATGNQAIDLIKQQKPDLILCDILMPHMDGYKFLSTLQQDKKYSDIPIVFVTALDSREELRKGMCRGVDDYLTKPFNSEELLACVTSRLNRISLLKCNQYSDCHKQELELINKLTPREFEVLNMVSNGATSKEIASSLNICIKTVEIYRSNLLKKLNAKNSAQLVRLTAAKNIPPV